MTHYMTHIAYMYKIEVGYYVGTMNCDSECSDRKKIVNPSKKGFLRKIFYEKEITYSIVK